MYCTTIVAKLITFVFCLKYALNYVSKMQAPQRLVFQRTIMSTGNNTTYFKSPFDA